jgi:hypothetical protein
MSDLILHVLNPLHVYCRMRDLRVRKGLALFVCRIYEHTIFRLLKWII